MTIRPKVAGIAAVLVFVFAVMGFEIHARHSAAASASMPMPKPSTAGNSDLRQIMENSVHHDYTAMSFTIWHDRPLTSTKMDSIAEASSRIAQAAQGLEAFEDAYRQQGWSARDVKFFDEKRLQLSQVAEELNRAAMHHDAPQVVNFFMHMDNTCQSCHRRFRPDLSWT